jgi:ribose 5-phosphate isomerase A
MATFNSDDAKRRAAARAMELVKPGMRLGLGTGTTAKIFVDLLGAGVASGLEVVCVPTSERTRSQAASLSIPVSTLDETPELDLTIDGADEFDSQLRLIKGGGGAHLREKIVASASARMIVIADSSKFVVQLGKFPLPIEVVSFGLEATRRMIGREAKVCGCDGSVDLRRTPSGHPFVTDNGNYIIDCLFGSIPEPEILSTRLLAIPGVVETGLFIGLATAVISAGPTGLEIFGQID